MKNKTNPEHINKKLPTKRAFHSTDATTSEKYNDEYVFFSENSRKVMELEI